VEGTRGLETAEGGDGTAKMSSSRLDLGRFR
jgi:hypothetical protein